MAHDVKLEHHDTHGGRTFIRAACGGCPWRGRLRETEERATRDGDAHVKKSGGTK